MGMLIIYKLQSYTYAFLTINILFNVAAAHFLFSCDHLDIHSIDNLIHYMENN